MNYKIMQNFLDKNDADYIEKEIVGNSIPWEIVMPNVPLFKSTDTRRFREMNSKTIDTHVKNEEVSEYAKLTNILFEKIKQTFDVDFVVSRCRINYISAHFNSWDYYRKIDVPHVDVLDYSENMYTGIYYINTCESILGSTTIFKNTVNGSNALKAIDTIDLVVETGISSTKNNFAIWEANVMHSGPGFVDMDRYVINFNITTNKKIDL